MKKYKTKLRLNTTKSVNRLMARTINSLIDDNISESKARTIGYLANILYKGLEQGDLEERLGVLEELINKEKVS